MCGEANTYPLYRLVDVQDTRLNCVSFESSGLSMVLFSVRIHALERAATGWTENRGAYGGQMRLYNIRAEVVSCMMALNRCIGSN